VGIDAHWLDHKVFVWCRLLSSQRTNQRVSHDADQSLALLVLEQMISSRTWYDLAKAATLAGVSTFGSIGASFEHSFALARFSL